MNAYNLEQNSSHRTDTFLLFSLKELPPSLKSDERIGEGGGRWNKYVSKYIGGTWGWEGGSRRWGGGGVSISGV